MQLPPVMATAAQKEVLKKILFDDGWEKIDTMTKAEAWETIAHHSRSWRGYDVTQRQEVFLRNWGKWRPGLNRGQASDLIAAIKAKVAKMTPEEAERARLDALDSAWQG